MLLYGVPYMNGKMDSYSNDQYMYWIIWFHDFVYQGLPTDEILSAHAASFRFFKTFHIPYSLELDMNIVFPIYSTQHRGLVFELMESHKYGFARLLCDLDLLGLADSWDDYMNHSKDVLEEAYLLHKGMYSKFELIRKRAIWLNSFLQRKCIYQIPHFQYLNENRAISNMVKELEEIIECHSEEIIECPDFDITTMVDIQHTIQRRKEELKFKGISI
jgi:predicted metal-dependent HD superfamily phosphohydrolase